MSLQSMARFTFSADFQISTMALGEHFQTHGFTIPTSTSGRSSTRSLRVKSEVVRRLVFMETSSTWLEVCAPWSQLDQAENKIPSILSLLSTPRLHNGSIFLQQ